MAATVFTIAQQKGGAGKTTLAIHLAVAWSTVGHNVGVLDIDPQASLTLWHKLRAELHPELADAPKVHTVTGWRASGEIERLKKAHEIVVVDSPPHTETEARIVIREADLLIVPIQPSVMDLWATRATLDIAKAEKTKVLLVLNRVPARSKAADEIIEAAAKLGVPVAGTTLGSRVALAAAINKGYGISEFQPTSAAGHEIAALAAEILGR
jgi:chromosome partitioning protein